MFTRFNKDRRRSDLISRSDVRWCFRQDGKPIRPGELRGCVSRLNAIFMIAT